MVDVNIVYLGVGLLLAPALGEWAKIRSKEEKGFSWLGAAGALFLLAAAFTLDLGAFGIPSATLNYGLALFGIIGIIAALIGALLVLASIFK